MSLNRTTPAASNCDAIIDLIPEYAFGLTDAAQTRLVESQLDACPEAVAQLEEFRALQEQMRESIPQVDPPADLGDRLLAAVAADPQPAPPAIQALPAKPRRAPRWAWIAAAAAVIALVISNSYWLTRVGDLEQRQNELAALISAQSGDSAFVLTSTDSLRWVRLPGDEQLAADASAFMMWDGSSETGLLYARGFPELDPGYKYHLWLTREGVRTFVGILQVDDEGDGALLFHSPEPIDNFAWAWVTAESENDSSGEPSTPAVVRGEL